MKTEWNKGMDPGIMGAKGEISPPRRAPVNVSDMRTKKKWMSSSRQGEHNDCRSNRGNLGEAYTLRKLRQKSVGYTVEKFNYEISMRSRQ